MAARARWASAATTAAMTLAAMTLTGCEAPLGAQEVSFEPLQGQWIACLNDGGADYSTLVVFFPDASFSSTTRTYATIDGTCGGTATSTSKKPWRYALAESVPAQLGEAGPQVVAQQMTIQDSFETIFTIVYVDSAAVPPKLYFGDLALDPVEDGTAPEKRPDVLSVSTALTSQ